MAKLFILILCLKVSFVFGAYENLQFDDTYEAFHFPISPGSNSTLDLKEDANGTYWRVPKNSIGLWMEYYDDTSLFQLERNNPGSCANVTSESIVNDLPNSHGIWVACQDRHMPEGCESVANEPCYPLISFSAERPVSKRIRTVKVSFVIYGLGLIRIKTEGNQNGRCLDYSLRRDRFSPCEFVQLDNVSATESGWRQLVFTHDYYDNVWFGAFSIQLISRFAKDVIIVDKVEATDFLLCEDGESVCPRPTLPPTEDTDGTDETGDTSDITTEMPTSSTTTKTTVITAGTTTEDTTTSTTPPESSSSSTSKRTTTTTQKPNGAGEMASNITPLICGILFLFKMSMSHKMF